MHSLIHLISILLGVNIFILEKQSIPMIDALTYPVNFNIPWYKYFQLEKQSIPMIDALTYPVNFNTPWCKYFQLEKQSIPMMDALTYPVTFNTHWCKYFQLEKQSIPMIDALTYPVNFNIPLLITCFRVIESLIFRREIEFNGVYFLGFVQKTLHDFRNTVLNS